MTTPKMINYKTVQKGPFNLYECVKDPGAVGGDSPPTGISLIAKERQRQFDAVHLLEDDDELTGGELAYMAACYTSPVKAYKLERSEEGSFCFTDLWPERADRVDKRWGGGPGPEDPCSFLTEKRIDLLVRAGALIAAEIDRLNRVKKTEEKEEEIEQALRIPEEEEEEDDSIPF